MKKTTLTFSENQYTAASDFIHDGLEDVTYCLASRFDSQTEATLVVREVLASCRNNMTRTRYSVTPSPEFLCSMYSKMQAAGCDCIVQMHTHPFSIVPQFSAQDMESARGLICDARSVHRGANIVQIVYGANLDHYNARYFGTGAKMEPLPNIRIVGPNGIRTLSKTATTDPVYNADDRNVLTFGASGCAQIQDISVLLLGASGLGSALAFMLSRIGVRSIVICDMDKIDQSNLNRMFMTTHPGSAVGRSKAHFVCKQLRRFDSTGHYNALHTNVITEDDIIPHLKRADIVIQAVDNDAARLVMNRLCARYGKPLLNVSNSITRAEGVLSGANASCQWFLPGEPDYPCLECAGGLNVDAAQEGLRSDEYRAMREEAGYVSGTNQSPEPQVVPINSLAAATAVWQMAAWAAGIHPPPAWTYQDSVTNTIRTMSPTQDHNCTACSTSRHSCLAAGDSDQGILDDGAETATQHGGRQ